MNQLESEILEYLRGEKAQTVCAVAIAVKAGPKETRQALHNLVASGDVLLIRGERNAEYFEPAHGGYMPPEAA